MFRACLECDTDDGLPSPLPLKPLIVTSASYWLMKSEPNVSGIEHLRNEKGTLWDGIRNYQARNFMRKMKIGDQAFFYHSNCKPHGVVGLMEVTETGLVATTQFDARSN